MDPPNQKPTRPDGNPLEQRQRCQTKSTITVDNAAVLATNSAIYSNEYRALAFRFGVRSPPYSTPNPLPGFGARLTSLRRSSSTVAPGPSIVHLRTHTSMPRTSVDPSPPTKEAMAFPNPTNMAAGDKLELLSGQTPSVESVEFGARPQADATDLHLDVKKSTSCSLPAISAISLSKRQYTEPRLPREILLMVFEGLVNTPHLRGMRLVSQQFSDLIVPILYRHVTLTPSILRELHMDTRRREDSSDPRNITPLYLQIALFTKHISVDRDLDLDSVCRLLEDLDGLESLEWSYWEENDTLGPSLSLSQYRRRAAFNERLHDILDAANTRIHVERLNVVSMRSTWLSIKPPFPLVTFKVDVWRSSKCPDIKPVLMKHPELETVHLIGERKYVQSACVSLHDWKIRPHERMPAVKELVLENYYWGHSPQKAVIFWNWKQITHLELKNVSMVKFLQTVPPKHLVRLRCLVLDEDIDYEAGEATSLMADLVHKIYALERLSLTCKPRRVVTSVLKHGPTLRSLQLYSCFEVGADSWKTLSVADLDAINACCPHIMQLGLEVYFMGETSPANALHMDSSSLSNMRNLRRLNLYSRIVYVKGLSTRGYASYSHLHTLLQGWLDEFLLAKKGAHFESICINVRVVEAPSDASTHVSWVYRHGKGLSTPKVE